MRNSIIVIGTGTQYEAIALAAIKPGHAVELLSTGKVQKKASASTVGEKAFAIEDYLQGNAVDDDYAAADRIMYRIFNSGDEVYAILADGENVAIGDELDFAAAGEVQATASAGTSRFIAVEALDASASAGVAVDSRRIVIRII